MKLNVNPGPLAQTNEARYLLVPCPPSTSWQGFVGLESSICSPVDWLQAENAAQEAWLFEAPASGEAEFVFHFSETAAQRSDDKRLFASVASPLTQPSAELCCKVSELTSGCCDDGERLAALIAFTASLFDYDHPERPFNHGHDRIPLLGELTKGNCADIHGFLVSCLYAAGLDVSYMAGFCFSGDATMTRGYHCWLTSRIAETVQHWDVAQHVKADITPVRAGLNPLGGRRVAMSVGRGLVFTIAGQRLQLPHLGYPMWICADGAASGIGASARLTVEHTHPETIQRIEEVA
ncbi:MAG: transglutaminase-like domain-containing protein [Bosea sp. (in: a-proteobacteria)]